MSDTPSYTFQPIGRVESPYKEKFGTPRQPGLVTESRGTIILREDLNPDAFDGLAEFSHVWVLFVFHENQSVRDGRPTVKTKVHPPRLEGKAVGVFATRSPHRPNPIGLSLVRIEKIEGRRLSIYGLDLIDGTPVLDLKPYIPTIEAIPEAYEGWSGPLPARSVSVEWSDEAVAMLEKLVSADADVVAREGEVARPLDAADGAASARHARAYESAPEPVKPSGADRLSAIMTTIGQSLELDPRPVAYRGTVENPDPYTSLYGFRFENWNIVFRMIAVDDPPASDLPAPEAVTAGHAKRARIERVESWNTRGTATSSPAAAT